MFPHGSPVPPPFPPFGTGSAVINGLHGLLGLLFTGSFGHGGSF